MVPLQPAYEVAKIKYKLLNFDITKLLNVDVQAKINETGYSPISIILLREVKGEKPEEKIEKVSIITIGYEKSTDAKKKIAYIEGEEPEILLKTIESILKVVGDGKQ